MPMPLNGCLPTDRGVELEPEPSPRVDAVWVGLAAPIEPVAEPGAEPADPSVAPAPDDAGRPLPPSPASGPSTPLPVVCTVEPHAASREAIITRASRRPLTAAWSSRT